jgi:molybdopterin/thiamine biosynthesis adenylyltransferase
MKEANINYMQHTFEPVFIKDAEAEALKSKSETVYIDAHQHQIKELFIIDHPQFSGEKKQEGFATEQFTEYAKRQQDNFVYVYYPWNYTLVKTMPENEYFRLKTNRNQDLITFDEQQKLSNLRVGVFGMSVGSNVALVLTQAGISREIVIADFDELDTTNLNRIVAGVHQVGLNKTIIAARKIYEDNPFAKVVALQEGLTKENLEQLLSENKLDIIVEEVDSLPIKIQTRELALKYKKPVIMITDNGDGVVLHIERYDLGYDKVFNKPFEYWTTMFATKPTMEQIGKMIIGDILGGPQNVPKRVFQSVERIIKKELVSWSQLGSAALLGGVVATVAIKRIALGEHNELYVEKNIQIDF